jgi:hypothetical protein
MSCQPSYQLWVCKSETGAHSFWTECVYRSVIRRANVRSSCVIIYELDNTNIAAPALLCLLIDHAPKNTAVCCSKKCNAAPLYGSIWNHCCSWCLQRLISQMNDYSSRVLPVAAICGGIYLHLHHWSHTHTIVYASQLFCIISSFHKNSLS